MNRKMNSANTNSGGYSHTSEKDTLASNSGGFKKSAFIRGVNIGGWLLLERFITPYMFALTDCHVRGEFCFFPKQISAPRVGSADHQYCDMFQCEFLLDEKGHFPAVDEYTLASQFQHKALTRTYLSYHWDNFVTKKDVERLKDAGVTHVKVPMPHWIMGDIQDDEPWVDGQWLFFVRFVGWCREYGIEVWPDIHTAPGSQNGFDNSGQLLEDAPTCQHWSSSPVNVKRSLKVVEDISQAILRDNLEDVVTGFGVLNEPFADCDTDIVKKFYLDALKIVRESLGTNIAVYIGDMFNATEWNDGWWTDEDEFSNTLLDSHYYHVFDENVRQLSPKQHIALVCAKETRNTQSCCYQDAPTNQVPSKGISRIIGEWTAAYDSEPKYRMFSIMKEILNKKGDTANFDLPVGMTNSADQQAFLRHFVQAQMVAYESANQDSQSSISRGWFFWTLKMEFELLGRWDFLRGFEEGWIPRLPNPDESSESVFGTCKEIAEKTKDNMEIVNEYPDPKTHSELWKGPPLDDDFVLSHAGSLSGSSEVKEPADRTNVHSTEETPSGTKHTSSSPSKNIDKTSYNSKTYDDSVEIEGKKHRNAFPLFCIIFFAWGIWKVFFSEGGNFTQNRSQYSNIDTPTRLNV